MFYNQMTALSGLVKLNYFKDIRVTKSIRPASTNNNKLIIRKLFFNKLLKTAKEQLEKVQNNQLGGK